MEKFNKILVCLDQSSLDEQLIQAAGKICELSPREVTFINVIKEFELPSELLKEFPNFIENALEERKAQIRENVVKNFSWPDLDVKIKILQGEPPAKAILTYASKKEIDLIIAGRKKKNTSSGVLMSRLARRADCSFLMIAEGRSFDLKKILVPIDFSEHSGLAIEKAIDFSSLVENNVDIYAQNVYTVPSGYHYTGKTLDEFAQIMKENAMKSFETFMRTIDTRGQKIKPVYSLNDNDDFVSDIREYTKKHKIDLIIIGARGQTRASMLFIGSQAERIVMMNTSASMLVIRRKGDKAGFRELLQEL
jgi:nucleotide-binding universal stress UspA family protein